MSILLNLVKSQKTFNSLHGLAAPYLAELLSRHQPTRSLRYADAHLLVEPRSNLKTQDDRAFSHAAPCLWNNLPLAMGVLTLRNCSRINSILFYLNVHFYLNCYTEILTHDMVSLRNNVCIYYTYLFLSCTNTMIMYLVLDCIYKTYS